MYTNYIHSYIYIYSYIVISPGRWGGRPPESEREGWRERARGMERAGERGGATAEARRALAGGRPPLVSSPAHSLSLTLSFISVRVSLSLRVISLYIYI